MTAQPIQFILMMELQDALFTAIMEPDLKVTDGTALNRQQQLLHKILRRKQQHLRLERRRHISHRTQLDRNRKQHPRHERQQPRPRQRRRRKMGNSRRRRRRLKQQQLRTNNTKHHIQLRLRSSNRQRSIIALRSNFRKYLNKLQHRRRQRRINIPSQHSIILHS